MSDIRFNQWLHQSGTGGVTQLSSGHVGIGTTNPLIPVHSGNNAVLNVGVVTANNIYAGTINGTLALSDISGISGSFTSDLTVNGPNLDISDKIRHIGDTNTAIRFPANDTITFETSGDERLRIDSTGDIGLGESNPNRSGYSSPVVSVGYNSSNGYGVLELLGNQTSDNTIANIVAYNVGGTSRIGAIAFERSGANNSGAIRFETYASGSSAERMRISKDGHITKPTTAIFSARGQGSWNTFNSGSGWYNLGTSSYSGSNYYINHGWTTSGGACGVRGVTSAGNSVWDNAAARFTAPVAGFYFFEISMYIRTYGGGKTFHVQPWLDSSNLNYYTSNIGNIRNSSDSLTGNTQQYPNSVMRSIVLYMAANQQFRWSVYSEGTTNFQTHFDYAHQSGYLIG